jgi:hypothetical protein
MCQSRRLRRREGVSFAPLRGPAEAGGVRGSRRKCLIGEMAERSKALDWNSSNIFTGVRGFESHSLRHRLLRNIRRSVAADRYETKRSGITPEGRPRRGEARSAE